VILEEQNGVAGQADALARPPSAVGRTSGRLAGMKRQNECRTLVDARAADFDVASMELNEIVNNRETEPEPPMPARRRAVRLPEPIEYVRQEPGIEADAGVRHLDPNALVDLIGADRDAAATRRELDRIGQEIPQHLLQPRGVGQNVGVLHVPRRVNREVLGLRRRPHARQRRLEHRHDRQRFEIDLQLAGGHA